MGAKPLVIGLTGSIGCGKSSVMQTLIGLGAEGIDADKVAHAVSMSGLPAYAAVVADFGAGILAPDGEIDRRKLGQRVFADPAALARLEAIVHPAVNEAIRSQVAASRAPVVVIEAIKLLEAGLSRALCDEVWVVTCKPEQQEERLAASRGMSAAEVARRRAAQMPPAEMLNHADRVIDSQGTPAATSLQVLVAWCDLGLPLPPPVIRPATLADAGGIAAVIEAIIAEGGLTVLDHPFSLEEELAYLRSLEPRERIMVATVGDVLVAHQSLDLYAKYTHAMDHVGVLGTFVHKALRSQGLGRALSAATIDFARGAGFRKFVITVRADNPGAQAFYLSWGFRPCGRLVAQAFVNGREVDELLYEKFLEE
ncbi:MAG TPA: dephospho-CoA kinase [Anaerolineae bacterium]